MRYLVVVILGLMLALAPARLSVAQEPAKIEPLTIVSADSATLFSAEIADTEDLRARGLMFRHKLPEGQAMLFDFGTPKPAAMWMKNTYMSLDMIFVRPDGTIAAIAENTVPKSLDTISVQEPVRGVIELPAGTVKKLGVQQNDKVYHRIFATAE
jgi:uncharacterized membrane protein (UPF0127 family)